MLNWYSDQVMQQHNERIEKALEDYAINQALAASRSSHASAGALFRVGRQLVRWGYRLQANGSGRPSDPYFSTHR